MKNWIFKNKLVLSGAVAGAIGGYFYYRLVGCADGTCLISSKPLNSIIYFGIMGAVFLSLFKKKQNQQAQ